jgi:predicted patatin/cPLA2 family phospholipase
MKPTPIDVLCARRAGVNDDHRVALVVEGGCMRGVISAGAVTALEHLHLAQRFDAVYGVSAGALACAYMLAGQAAMGTTIYFDDLPAAHLVRARRIVAARPPIALDEVIDDIVARRKRLDVAAVENARPEFHVLATCLEHRALERPHGPLLERLRAAARVPLLSGPPVRINGCRLYDGGLLSPLPVDLAAADGATHILVLRTRPDGPAVRRHAHVERAMLSWLHRAHPETRSMPVVPGGRYERQLAALPAGITAHGEAQVQVIVPHSPPMSQSEMNPAALRAGAWTGLTSVERVVGERVDRGVLVAHTWR